MEIAGKNILVTGGTSGLGLELSKRLISEGAFVYAMGRSLKEEIQPSNSFRFIKTDFASLRDIQDSLDEIVRQNIIFDLVINNAGVLTPPGYNLTTDGFEYSFQVNFLSHLLIDWWILEMNCHSIKPLFLSVTSPVYKYYTPRYTLPLPGKFSSFTTYAETKYYVLLIGDFLRKNFPGKETMFAGFSPGTFNSGIYRMQHRWFRKMYRVGGFFMRDAGKVAGRLLRVIENETENNTVYLVSGKKRSFVPDNKKASAFMDFCLGEVQSRLRDAH